MKVLGVVLNYGVFPLWEESHHSWLCTFLTKEFQNAINIHKQILIWLPEYSSFECTYFAPCKTPQPSLPQTPITPQTILRPSRHWNSWTSKYNYCSVSTSGHLAKWISCWDRSSTTSKVLHGTAPNSRWHLVKHSLYTLCTFAESSVEYIALSLSSRLSSRLSASPRTFTSDSIIAKFNIRQL